MNNYLNYIMKVNGTKGKTNRKEIFIDEMSKSYDEARENYISRFDVMINSNEAKCVKADGKDIKCLIKYNDTKESETTGNYVVKIQTHKGNIKEGSIIEFKNDEDFKNETYFVMTKVENIKNYSQAYIRYCNRSFKIHENGDGVPVILDNTTYGVKGIKDGAYYKELDDKMKGWIQANDLTKDIYEGMRILLKNKSEFISNDINEWVSYKIMKKDFVVLANQYIMELEMCALSPLDDLENGIAYNDKFEEESIDEMEKIYGDDTLRINQIKKYEVCKINDFNIKFELSNSKAKILNSTSKICEIQGVSSGITTLNAKLNDRIIACINIMIYK